MSIFIRVFLCFILSCMVSGCIGRVQWVERPGGNPEAQHIIPVCPHCKEVVNYYSLQCNNPECRKLLKWSEYIAYSPEPYSPTNPNAGLSKIDSSATGDSHPASAKNQVNLAEPKVEVGPSAEQATSTGTGTPSSAASSSSNPNQTPTAENPTTPKGSPTTEPTKNTTEDKLPEDDWEIKQDEW